MAFLPEPIEVLTITRVVLTSRYIKFVKENYNGLSGRYIKNTVPANDLTFILADGIKEEHVGLAVVQDSTASNTVKLAGDGDLIFGRLENVEDRKVEGIKVGAVKLSVVWLLKSQRQLSQLVIKLSVPEMVWSKRTQIPLLTLLYGK